MVTATLFSVKEKTRPIFEKQNISPSFYVEMSPLLNCKGHLHSIKLIIMNKSEANFIVLQLVRVT